MLCIDERQVRTHAQTFITVQLCSCILYSALSRLPVYRFVLFGGRGIALLALPHALCVCVIFYAINASYPSLSLSLSSSLSPPLLLSLSLPFSLSLSISVSVSPTFSLTVCVCALDISDHGSSILNSYVHIPPVSPPPSSPSTSLTRLHQP